VLHCAFRDYEEFKDIVVNRYGEGCEIIAKIHLEKVKRGPGEELACYA